MLNNKMRKIIMGCIAATIIIVGWYGFKHKSLNDSTVEYPDVTVACNLPLTGIFSAYGESIKDGILFAMSDLKPLLENKKIIIEYDFQDNKSLAKDAQMVALKQFQSPVDVYVGGIAQPLYSILNTVDKKNIPFFTWGFEAYLLKNHKNTYRTWINLNAETSAYINYIIKYNPKKVFLLRPQTVGSELQFNEQLIPFLKSKNISYKEEVFENNKTDFKDIALKAKIYNADLYIINGFDFHLINLVKNFRVQGIMDARNVYWSLDLLDAANKLDKTSLEGLRTSAPSFLVRNEKYKQWCTRFEKKFNRSPRYTDAYAYDMAHILAYASIEKKGKLIDWRTALLQVKFDGITGMVYFRDDRDLIYNIDTCIFHDGALIKEMP